MRGDALLRRRSVDDLEGTHLEEEPIGGRTTCEELPPDIERFVVPIDMSTVSLRDASLLLSEVLDSIGIDDGRQGFRPKA